jgi:signal transduction histidine kinase
MVDGDARRLRAALPQPHHQRDQVHAAGGGGAVAQPSAGDEIAFTVRDIGHRHVRRRPPHVFERFWRADRARSRTSERGGFGLGLAISQWIAQAHGGRIAVQSRLGRGSVFTVTLPARR